jgi:NTP pyrophosphatase (non-canonical NTP hydrolase)
MTEYDDFIDQLVYGMKFKLRLNQYKGALADRPMEDLINHLRDEVDELVDAINKGKSREDVMLECADVANLALAVFISTVVQKRDRVSVKEA